jgi:IclR family transcriptional regulator, acetate operon repressor
MVAASVKPNQSLGRAFSVLEYLAEHPGARLKDVAAGTELAAPTALRFLGTLVELGYVQQHEHGYVIGARLASLSRGMWSGDVAGTIAASLAEVADQLGCTAFFVLRDRDEAIYVQRAQPRQAAFVSTQRIGKRVPLYCSGVGKVFLAGDPLHKRQQYCQRAELNRYTDATITEPMALLRHLEQVANQGYAVDDQECETGVRCLAVPVRDGQQRLRAAMSVSGPLASFPPDQQALPVLQQAATALAPYLQEGAW